MKMKSNDKRRGRPRRDVSRCSGCFAPIFLFLASTCLSAASREPFAAVLETTFTNPTPAIYERFGASLALMRGDRVLIGAPGANDFLNQYGSPAGAAYLFDVN